MKCPSCSNDQKKKEGSACKTCGYVFALDPKAAPYISDYGMNKTIDKLTGGGRYHFTYNELYAALHAMSAPKTLKTKRALVAVVCVGAVIATLVLRTFLGWGAVIVPLAAAVGIILLIRRPSLPKYEDVSNCITTYRQTHKIQNLASGVKFGGEIPRDQIKAEFFTYAPERILIVQRDDMVDMLVMNRFHVENKTAIVSVNKYPAHVFDAVMRFLEKKPDIPIQVMHDASLEGERLVASLKANKSWNLADKNVTDLGVFLADVENVKDAVWLPGRTTVGTGGGKTAQELAQQGMRVPVDSAPPNLLLGAMGLAVVSALALAGTDLLAMQAAQKDTSNGFG
jgi:hypothetical protein